MKVVIKAVYFVTQDIGEVHFIPYYGMDILVFYSAQILIDPPDRGIPHPYLVAQANYVAQDHYDRAKSTITVTLT